MMKNKTNNKGPVTAKRSPQKFQINFEDQVPEIPRISRGEAGRVLRSFSEGGFTLVEAMVAAAIAVIVMIGVSIVLYDSQRGWNATYNRVYSEVVTGSHVAQRAFDAIVRKSSSQYYLIDGSGQWVEVYYYADPNSPQIDRYARFFEQEGRLVVEYGRRNPREKQSEDTLCDSVTFCAFQQTGRSMQMMLTLDNGREKLDTTTSAVLHN